MVKFKNILTLPKLARENIVSGQIHPSRTWIIALHNRHEYAYCMDHVVDADLSGAENCLEIPA